MPRKPPQRLCHGAMLAVTLLFSLRCASARDYLVTADPAVNGAFRSVQAAIEAAAGQNDSGRANIFIAPGAYYEAVTVTQPFISLIGVGASADATRIVFRSKPNASSAGFSWGAVVDIQPSARGFMARNLTFENLTPDENITQALAAQASADEAIYDNVRFVGYQDTLLTDGTARMYFRNCFITGDTDFIFGNATAVFDHCAIESTDRGFITAANTQRITANGLIFLDCELLAGTDQQRSTGDRSYASGNSVYLGRPWLWFEPDLMPSTIFIRTRMQPHLTTAGWDPWNNTGRADVDPTLERDPRTRYSESASSDASGDLLRDTNGNGTPDGRVAWADPMTPEQAANYTLEHIFGPADFWNAQTQPETSGEQYQDVGPAWNPTAQLAFLPSQPGVQAQPLNLSTRLRVQEGDRAMITGFIISGDAPKQVMLRALGPSLQVAGVAGALADPVLELRDSNSALLASNDNWKVFQRAQIEQTGVAPLDDREPAILATLSPGAYTAIIRGASNTDGVALAEIYDLDPATGMLANISTRGSVGPGDDIMIAGFILARGSADTKIMIRGLGPSLADAGVRDVLADPALQLRDGNGALLADNANWRDSQEVEIEQTGIAPSATAEAAILASLPPGLYTAMLAGSAEQSGVALIEIYNIP